jgi:hypothetical protein
MAAVCEELQARVAALEKALEAKRQTVAALTEHKRTLKHSFVELHATLEQDEEFISNTLLKRIRALEAQRQALEVTGIDTAHLEAQLRSLKQDKIDLENLLDEETEYIVNKLTKDKRRLESENTLLQAQLHHCPAHEKLVADLTEQVASLKARVAQQHTDLSADVRCYCCRVHFFSF